MSNIMNTVLTIGIISLLVLILCIVTLIFIIINKNTKGAENLKDLIIEQKSSLNHLNNFFDIQEILSLFFKEI